jgi:hypothetical protein
MAINTPLFTVTMFISGVIIQCWFAYAIAGSNNDSFNRIGVKKDSNVLFKHRQHFQKQQKYVHKGEFSLLETNVAPATPNTRDDPDAMQLPLKKYSCGCYLAKSRLQVVSFFESFEYIEEYEEGKNGDMMRNEITSDPPLPPSAKPDYLECSCKHQNLHIDKKLLGQGSDDI